MAAASLGMIGSVIAVFQAQTELTNLKSVSADFARLRDAAQQNRVAAKAAEEQVKRLSAENDSLRRALQMAQTKPQSQKYAILSPADRNILDRLSLNHEGFNSRLSSLENVLLTTPERALALPLMKQQVDGMQDRFRSDSDTVRGEIGRLYTLTLWLMGLMFTIALGLFTLALNNLRRKDPKTQ